jgi:hypothetical protein
MGGDSRDRGLGFLYAVLGDSRNWDVVFSPRGLGTLPNRGALFTHRNVAGCTYWGLRNIHKGVDCNHPGGCTYQG